MTRGDRLWLAGIIWGGLGISHDRWVLTLGGLLMFGLGLWERGRGGQS